MDRQLISVSRFLSLVLRHRPQVIGMQLDAEGWLEIAALIDHAGRHGHSLTLEQLHDAVALNDKQRFALSDDGLRIRARQGHSIREVDLNLVPRTPPPILLHGTIAVFLPSIRVQGLVKRSRNHVHLSADEETARRVAARRGRPVILTVAALPMHTAGHQFFVSENGVWLTDHVPTEFLEFPP